MTFLEHDPHGFIISLVSILVIFAVMAVLYIAFKATAAIIGKGRSGAEEPASTPERHVTAPLPGVITFIKVRAGERVKAGQTVAVLEAMKMENEIHCVHEGTVKAVNVKEGDFVQDGDILITIG